MPDLASFSEILKQPFARQLEKVNHRLYLAQEALATGEQQVQSCSEPEREAVHQQIRLLHVKFAKFPQLRQPIALDPLDHALRSARRFVRLFSYRPRLLCWRLRNADLWLRLNLLNILLFILAQAESWLATQAQPQPERLVHFIRRIKARLPKIF